MRVDEGNADGDSQAQVSALLVLVVLAVFVVLFFYIITEVRSELRKDFEAIRSSTMAKSPNLRSPKEVVLIRTNVQIDDYASCKTPMDGNLATDDHSLLGTTI